MRYFELLNWIIENTVLDVIFIWMYRWGGLCNDVIGMTQVASGVTIYSMVCFFVKCVITICRMIFDYINAVHKVKEKKYNIVILFKISVSKNMDI